MRFTLRAKFSLGGEFTESPPAPDNYLIAIRLPDKPPFVPEDGKSYLVGGVFNGVRIIGMNNTREFFAASLEADTLCAVDVYAFNGKGNRTNYLGVTALPAEPAWTSKLRVYPNSSAGGIFQVKFPTAMLRQGGEAHTLRIADLQGRAIVAHALSVNDLLFDKRANLESQPSGVCLLLLETPEGLIVRKLAKK